MQNFIFHNPVKVVFGKGEISKIAELIPEQANILLTFGGSSIKKNGVYDQVKAALKNRKVTDFGGIEPNPDYATCMKAVKIIREEKIDFILAAGGGSVIDGSKFIAAAACFEGADPWDILSKGAAIKKAVPIGAILTLSGTGSEMNSFAVISKRETGEKLAFGSPEVFPKFSILDPETTFSLPANQTSNGVVDAFVHVLEQYMTYDVNAPLQDRQAEAILLTLMEEGKKVLETPNDYNVRANIMWCATQALNGNISAGVPQDWASHSIGHELTARFGLAHGESLAVIAPAVMRNQKENKKDKLLKYASRIWGITEGSQDSIIEQAIYLTEKFFREMGLKSKLSEYGIEIEKALVIADDFEARGWKLGERGKIGKNEVIEILKSAL
ncbi:iron-containing alcohol dehydrogenase [Desulforegula conservatrix]|uniref:iron-containing alcohol dehydrogenase n=1 Tax=Desulforegula conservatrix TaxID=153026 RepID=UPI000415D6C0|nr:iron-containing alcohol dehydrogenase [Desulforegula conservatrix]